MKSIFSFILVITMIASNVSLIASQDLSEIKSIDQVLRNFSRPITSNIANGKKPYKYDGAYEPILQSPSSDTSNPHTNHFVRAREAIVLDGVISVAQKQILPKIELSMPSNCKSNQTIKENIKPKSASPKNLVDQRVILSAIEPSMNNLAPTNTNFTPIEPIKNIKVLQPLAGNRPHNHPLFRQKYIHDTHLLSTIVENQN